MLHGLCLFGSQDNDNEVMLEIKDSSDDSMVVSEAATFYSKLMLYKGSSYYGFEILFDFAVYYSRKLLNTESKPKFLIQTLGLKMVAFVWLRCLV